MPSSSVLSPDVATARFQFKRLVAGRVKQCGDLCDAMSGDVGGQTWLFVGPHDDDLCLGGGMLMQAAVQSGVDVQVLIVTDGRMGYCRDEDRDTIVETRRRETFVSCRALGLSDDQVTFLGFPDGGLTKYAGRTQLDASSSAAARSHGIAGCVGLQNSLTHWLRKLKPARVFVPTATDLHPDHRITHSELMIGLFHAQGAIWPELGPPLIELPAVHELAVYCDFADAPNLEVRGNAAAFDTKLASIEAFASQVQIAALIDSVRRAGPYEYVRDVQFRLYSPGVYRSLFA